MGPPCAIKSASLAATCFHSVVASYANSRCSIPRHARLSADLPRSRPQMETCRDPGVYLGEGWCELDVGKLLFIIIPAALVCCGIIGCYCKRKKQAKRSESTPPSVSTPEVLLPSASPAQTAEPLVPTAVKIVIAEPNPSTVRTDLHAELSQLNLPELRQRASEEGVANDAIEVRSLSTATHAWSGWDVYVSGRAAHPRVRYGCPGSSRSRRTERSHHRVDRQRKPGEG